MDQMWGCQGTSQYQYVCGEEIICLRFQLETIECETRNAIAGQVLCINKEESQAGQVLCKLGECSLIDVTDVQADKFLPSIDDDRFTPHTV